MVKQQDNNIPWENIPPALHKRAKGNLMEDLAANYLQQHGLIILERNFTCRIGEIDIICQDQQNPNQQDLVFVEVRYRRTLAFGTPIESINYKKQQKLHAVATVYIQTRVTHRNNFDCSKLNYRFDVLGVTGNLAKPEIEWLRNVIFN